MVMIFYRLSRVSKKQNVANLVQAVRGMNDILPEQTGYWQAIEAVLKRVVAAYGYQEIRFPIVESTQLFSRSIGEVTDIVEKEMYTFLDRNGDSLTLRPEGTAGCIRAGIEHSLFYNQIQRLWYSGPMFRHERPQKGRYRQFYQFGVEAIGLPGPDIDVELILLSARLWDALGISEHVILEINSLGTLAARDAYRAALVDYFEQHRDVLDEDSKRRLTRNPLRILDSKNPQMQACIAEAPSLLAYLDPESKKHFDDLRRLLDATGLGYRVNPRLVRGLDYYSHTVFEWVTDSLGAQGTVCAGGRYDKLIEQLGGKPNAACGFALGLERLLLLCEAYSNTLLVKQPVDVYIIAVGELAQEQSLLLAERLRTDLPHLRLVRNCDGGSFKSQFKRADKAGAHIALILGDDEVAKGTVGIKFLREERDQKNVDLSHIEDELQVIVGENA